MMGAFGGTFNGKQVGQERLAGKITPSDYRTLVLATQPAHLLQYLPLSDASGVVATDYSGNSRNGAYTKVILGATGIGDGAPAVAFDGTQGVVDLYSVALKNALSGNEGSISLWFAGDAAVWTDGATRFLVNLNDEAGVDQLSIITNATNSTLHPTVKIGGDSYYRAIAGMSGAGWHHIGLTWSRANDEVVLYYEGAPYYRKTPVANPATNKYATMALSYDGGNAWHGRLAHIAIWDVPLTRAQMRALGSNNYRGSAVFFGDSITYGTGASDEAHTWRALVTASKGYALATNSGLGGTVLQNTVQNSAATIGAACDNNGRDTVATRVTDYHPDWVFILYGLNDLRLNDAAFSDALFQNDLGEVVDAIIADGTPASQIVLGSPPYCSHYDQSDAPNNGGSTVKHAAYTAAVAAVAAAKGTKYADIYAAMVAGGGDALLGVDYLHPNDAGHALIAATVLAALA